MSEPPKLDYWAGSEKRRPNKSQRVIGLLGFLVYCLPAFLFDALVVWSAIKMARFSMMGRLSILIMPAVIGGFCTWRAIAAIIQFFG